MAQKILQHEAAHARSGIEDGQDEQRLEHDREVIQEADQRLSPGLRKYVRHAERQRRPAAGAAEQRPFADQLRQAVHLRDGHRKTPARHRLHRLRRGLARPLPQARSRRSKLPGCITQAAIMAMMATKLSSSIEP